jgi:GT2 family glycosyltransferase
MTGESAVHMLGGWKKRSLLPGGMDDCSLIIPTFRRPREVVELLTSLVNVSRPPAEVIIVDGSPGTEPESAVHAWTRVNKTKFDLLFIRAPAGLTRQRNIGIDASTRDIVFFLDDDCIPDEGYFETVRAVFCAEGAERVGAVGGTVMNEIGHPISIRARMRLLLGLVPGGEVGKYYPTATSLPLSLAKPFSGTRPTDILAGCAMAFRKEVLQSYRFSHFFDGYSQGEDLEISLRIARYGGWKLVWCGDAHVVHNHVPKGRPAPFPKGMMEVRNRYFIMRRYSAGATIADKARFWLDIAYVFSYDIMRMLVHPTRLMWHGIHGLGVLWGAVRSAIEPPDYEERPAMREYEVDLQPWNDGDIRS